MRRRTAYSVAKSKVTTASEALVTVAGVPERDAPHVLFLAENRVFAEAPLHQVEPGQEIGIGLVDHTVKRSPGRGQMPTLRVGELEVDSLQLAVAIDTFTASTGKIQPATIAGQVSFEYLVPGWPGARIGHESKLIRLSVTVIHADVVGHHARTPGAIADAKAL